MCRGLLCSKFWRICQGILLEDFWGQSFPRKKREKSGDRIPQQSSQGSPHSIPGRLTLGQDNSVHCHFVFLGSEVGKGRRCPRGVGLLVKMLCQKFPRAKLRRQFYLAGEKAGEKLGEIVGENLRVFSCFVRCVELRKELLPQFPAIYHSVSCE